MIAEEIVQVVWSINPDISIYCQENKKVGWVREWYGQIRDLPKEYYNRKVTDAQLYGHELRVKLKNKNIWRKWFYGWYNCS